MDARLGFQMLKAATFCMENRVTYLVSYSEIWMGGTIIHQFCNGFGD